MGGLELLTKGCGRKKVRTLSFAMRRIKPVTLRLARLCLSSTADLCVARTHIVCVPLTRNFDNRSKGSSTAVHGRQTHLVLHKLSERADAKKLTGGRNRIITAHTFVTGDMRRRHLLHFVPLHGTCREAFSGLGLGLEIERCASSCMS